MNSRSLLYDPLNSDYRLNSLTPTDCPSIGTEIEASIVNGVQRTLISGQSLPQSFDFEIDPSIVEFNGAVLREVVPSSLEDYMRANLQNIVAFAQQQNSVIAPFGICPLADNASHVELVQDYLENHPSSAYRKLMARDSGLTTLLTGSSSIQCHVEQTNFHAIINQNIAHTIFAPYMVRLFANSVVFDGCLSQNPSMRMYNKMQMNFAGSLNIESLLAGPETARSHFIDLCNKMSSISPGYYLVRYFRPDLGTVENCTADFQQNLSNFVLFVRFCREISMLSIDASYIQSLLNFNPLFGSTNFLNETTISLNSAHLNLVDDSNFNFLISTLSDSNLQADIYQLARNPQWRESQSFLENRGVNQNNPVINKDLMYAYIDNFYNQFLTSIS